MKNFKIVIVLVLLSLKTGVNSSCMETLIATSNALTESIKELEETKAELEKVRAELEAERNKSTDQPDKEKPQIPVVYQCTFENSTGCGYSLLPTDKNAHWWVGHGKYAITTGPEVDHTLGTPDGQYLYINGQIEANDAENVFGYLRTARVDFPPIVPRNMSEFCISFWYSMYGKDVKTLRFYVKSDDIKNSDPVFAKDGNQGQGWKFFQYSLPKTKTKYSFSFEATTMAYMEIDMIQSKIIPHNVNCNIAIDDVKVIASPCTDPTPVSPKTFG